MDKLKEYSYIWEKDRDKYILLDDEFGTSIFTIDENGLVFVVIEDDILVDLIVAKMLENGNKVYNNIQELQEVVVGK